MLIAMPATPVPATEDWELRQPSQSNRGEFTGRRRVTILGEAPRWSTKVKLPTIYGEAAVRPWRSFLAQLQGRANSFRLIAVEGPQIETYCTVVVDGADQTGFMLETRGWSHGDYLKDGMFITVADQLIQVVGDVMADVDGKATIAIMPHLRAPSVDAAPVEVREPYAVVSLADDKAGWSVKPGPEYSIEFAVEEAF